jgi:hypothetical protein
MTAATTDAERTEQSNGRPDLDTPPELCHSGLGYEYLRCQKGDDDATVYVHQLLACLENDPESVFSPATEVKRMLEIPWLNVPENLHLTLAGRFEFPEEFEPEADEPTKAGVPISEYHRLHEVALQEGRSEVSQTLRRHMKQYQDPARSASD